MIITIAASTDSPEVARSLRNNPIRGVSITPMNPGGMETRSFPNIPINFNFNIDIDLSLAAVSAVVSYLVGRSKAAGGRADLNIKGKELSTDEPELIEAELQRHEDQS